MRKTVVAYALVCCSLVACKGLDEADYARLNELFHQSQTRMLTPIEVEEIESIWAKKDTFDWEALLAALLGVGGGFFSTNIYRNSLRRKRSEPV